MAKAESSHQAVACIKSNDRVFVHGGAATPNVLLKALVERAPNLKNVEIIHLHTEGPALYAHPDHRDALDRERHKIFNIN